MTHLLRVTARPGLWALFASVLLAPAVAAQPAGFAPVSIYTLDDGRAVDQLGRSRPGQVSGATPTADRNGNPTGALRFDGVDDFVQTSEDSNFKPLTFSVWFRADDISGEHSIVDSDRSGGTATRSSSAMTTRPTRATRRATGASTSSTTTGSGTPAGGS